MGKGLGLLGNFNGKVGNTVGYAHKASKDKQTQGVRLHQPVVKNPKTYGQAEQRAKLAPVNATYRALKMIIDRGQEGKGYGNKSRLAWLKQAFNYTPKPWFNKGVVIEYPILAPLTRGSLEIPFELLSNSSYLKVVVAHEGSGSSNLVKYFSKAILDKYPQIHVGDTLTFVSILHEQGQFLPVIDNVKLDLESTRLLNDHLVKSDDTYIHLYGYHNVVAGTIIVTRIDDRGKRFLNKANYIKTTNYPESLFLESTKEAAIQSYMAADDSSDWEEDTQ